MRRTRVIPVLVALMYVMAQPAAALTGPNASALTCLYDLTGRWEVRLVAPGYQRLSAYTWAYDSVYLSTAPQWQPANSIWWGGPDRVWSWPLNSANPAWDGPYYNSLVLSGTVNTGHIYVHEYQWDADAGAWEAPRAYDCPVTQWVPSIYNWPRL